MNSSRHGLLCIVIIILQFSLVASRRKHLFCYRCLNIDCSDEDKDCLKSKQFIASELSNLYYLDDFLHPCPMLNDTFNWAIMQASMPPCPEQKAGQATCTLGRIQIKTTDIGNKLPTRYNHATVLGCAKRELLYRTRKSTGNQCDNFIRKQGNAGVVREVAIEHCWERESVCYGKDFCINWRNSGIKPWRMEFRQSSSDWNWNIILAMGALVGAAVLVALLIRMCSEPASRPNNSPKYENEHCLNTINKYVTKVEGHDIAEVLVDGNKEQDGNCV